MTHRSDIRACMRREDGTTLIELLVAAALALLVLSATLTILDDSVKLARVTDQRVDATQRGRDAMETITRELRSQVCLDSAAAITDATDTSVTYYVNLNGLDAVPERHSISLESGSLILRRFVPTGTPPSLTFPSTASSTRVLLEDVQPIGGTPLFRYYAWTAGATVVPTTLLATPLSAADRVRPVKFAISFRAYPSASFRSQRGSADLHDSVFVRTADPSDPTRGPQCN
jgi:type II secretory pathway pseudopilin PulG